jgi:hypothetical protein
MGAKKLPIFSCGVRKVQVDKQRNDCPNVPFGQVQSPSETMVNSDPDLQLCDAVWANLPTP